MTAERVHHDISVERAGRIHAAIRGRWGLGEPEGYGWVRQFDGWDACGSTYRTPIGVYSFEIRMRNGEYRVRVYRPKFFGRVLARDSRGT